MVKQGNNNSKAHHNHQQSQGGKKMGQGKGAGPRPAHHPCHPFVSKTGKSKDNHPNKNKAISAATQPQKAKPEAGASISTNISGLSALQQQFAKKLEGARFRVINEDLYTNPGHSSFQDFQANPEKFTIYHQGYREQAASWPINPLDLIINWVQKHHRNAIIADMGCGEARLAATVSNRVHSFDLVAANERITASDIAHVPLPDHAVDIAVFCLSLMGTNLVEFIKEAHRILKVGGLLKVVEVRSRFQDDQGIKDFNTFLKEAGFDNKANAQLTSNKMFFDVEAIRTNRPARFEKSLRVKSCVYKKR